MVAVRKDRLARTLAPPKWFLRLQPQFYFLPLRRRHKRQMVFLMRKFKDGNLRGKFYNNGQPIISPTLAYLTFVMKTGNISSIQSNVKPLLRRQIGRAFTKNFFPSAHQIQSKRLSLSSYMMLQIQTNTN